MLNFDAMIQSAHENQERLKPCCQVDQIIVDANNLLYRIGHMENHDTARIVIVFLEKLVMLRWWYGAKELHVCWEGADRNWRHQYLPEYKGNRDGDSELRQAVRAAEAQLRDVLAGTNFKQWDPINGEGDDAFAALAMQLTSDRPLDKTPSVGIYSTDRDLLQLASNFVTLIVPQRQDVDVAMRVADVRKKLEGLEPGIIPDLKGLEGDAGDNIPGVPGIGPKLALVLIKKHSNLEAVLEMAESADRDRQDGETKKAFRERLKDEMGTTETKLALLREHAEQAKTSKIVGGIDETVFLICHEQSQSKSNELASTIRRLGGSNYLTEQLENFKL